MTASLSLMWRTHSCVPHRDSSRCVETGIDRSVDAARRGVRHVPRFLMFLVATLAMADTPPIADENLRMSALHAIFPGMQISFVPGKRLGDPPPKKTGPYELDSPDPLATANVYRVIGKAMNEAEKCASDQILTGKASNTRLAFRSFAGQGIPGCLRFFNTRSRMPVPRWLARPSGFWCN